MTQLRVRTFVSVFDGTTTHEPGATIEGCALELARRLVVRGHGDLIDARNRKVPLARAIEELRLPEDDIVRIETADKTVLKMRDAILAKREG